MNRIILSRSLWMPLLLLFGGAACKPREADPLAAELKLLETAGFQPEGFSEREALPLQAHSCKGGTIASLSALMCEYPTDEGAEAGQEGAEAWIGDSVTGVVLTRGRFLLALSDPLSLDPNGKTISSIATVFRR